MARRLRSAAGRARRRGQAGATTLEVAIVIPFLIIGVAGMAEIVAATLEGDRWERAAHAAARAVALNRSHPDPKSLACEAIRSELQLDSDYDCWGSKKGDSEDDKADDHADDEADDKADDQPKYEQVKIGVKPAELPAKIDAKITSSTGDMVLVRVPWSRTLFSFESGYDSSKPGSVDMVAVGLARAEP